jgi:hypothetical protein
MGGIIIIQAHGVEQMASVQVQSCEPFALRTTHTWKPAFLQNIDTTYYNNSSGNSNSSSNNINTTFIIAMSNKDKSRTILGAKQHLPRGMQLSIHRLAHSSYSPSEGGDCVAMQGLKNWSAWTHRQNNATYSETQGSDEILPAASRSPRHTSSSLKKLSWSSFSFVAITGIVIIISCASVIIGNWVHGHTCQKRCGKKVRSSAGCDFCRRRCIVLLVRMQLVGMLQLHALHVKRQAQHCKKHDAHTTLPFHRFQRQCATVCENGCAMHKHHNTCSYRRESAVGLRTTLTLKN